MNALADRWGGRFVAGVEFYERGAFFEAHEAWEGLWRVEAQPAAKLVLQGLIQVAVGYHQHFTLRRSDAAVRLLERGMAKLDGADPLVREALAAFRAGVRSCVTKLRASPPASLRAEDVPSLALVW